MVSSQSLPSSLSSRATFHCVNHVKNQARQGGESYDAGSGFRDLRDEWRSGSADWVDRYPDRYKSRIMQRHETGARSALTHVSPRVGGKG